tara:strand:- start:109 stop:279 length:171 start_codon:yes stop_codon:yes gene_type:complete
MPDKSYKSNRERKKDSKYGNNNNIYSNKHIRNKENFFLRKNENENENENIKKKLIF